MQYISVGVLYFCIVELIGGHKVIGMRKEIQGSLQVAQVPQLLHILDVDDVQRVWVYDNVISQEATGMFLDYLTLPQIQREYLHKDYSWAENTSSSFENVTPWMATIDKKEFEHFTLWKNVKSRAEANFGRKVYLEHVQGEFLHSLNFKHLVHGWHCDHNVYIATVFMTTLWQHNNYGQLSFYNQTGNPNISSTFRFESVQTVHPKPGRMVVWPSCLTFIAHPPTVNYWMNLVSVIMWFNTNSTAEESRTNPNQNASKAEGHIFGLGDFVFSNSDANRNVEYKKHLKRSFYDSSERGIFVFDNLYTRDEVWQIQQWLLNIETTQISDFDVNALEDNDNVQWIKAFNASLFLKTPIWKRVHELTSYISGEDQWHPYDVALNYVHSADHTRIHPDASNHEHEYTYLLYLNEDISPNEFGETVWFDRVQVGHDGIHKFTGPGGEEYDAIAAVRPRFGRVVIFRNVIEHSARPLSTEHLGCRFSFAVKMSRTRRIAITKQIYESMEALDVAGMDDAMMDLDSELMNGDHDDERVSTISTEALEDVLLKVRAEVGKRRDEAYTKLVQALRN